MTKLSKNWFPALLEELQAIETEAVFNARWSLVEGYHNYGKRILDDREKFEAEGIKNEGEIVQRVARGLGKGKRTIYYALKFVKEYPDINALPEGKNISWRKIIRLLTSPKEKEEEKCDHNWICEKCGERKYEKTS